MMHMTYDTGRDYGRPQVLDIEVPGLAGADDWDVVPVFFRDDVRGIAGTVLLFRIQIAGDERVGEAVLAEYDAGRYTLAVEA